MEEQNVIEEVTIAVLPQWQQDTVKSMQNILKVIRKDSNKIDSETTKQFYTQIELLFKNFAIYNLNAQFITDENGISSDVHIFDQVL